LGLRTGLAATTIGLPSGYSRDLQDTKALCLDGVKLARQGLAVVAAAAPTLQPVRARILAALTPDIYATDEAYRLVREQGMAFRDAYREVGQHLDRVRTPDHDQVVRARTHAGSTGNLGLAALGERIAGMAGAWQARRETLETTWARLLAP
jgi:argininosuccinate lyase